MPFTPQFKQRVYRTGLRMGLPIAPFLHSVRASEIAMALPDVLYRKSVARELMRDSRWKDYVPQENGFRTFGSNEIPGGKDIVNLCRRLLESRRDKARVINRSEGNPFDMLFDRSVFLENPELVEFAVSDPLAEIATDYFETVPRLEYIDLWVSKPHAPNKALFNSQLYHIDKIDYPLLTMFMAVEPIDDDCGPFTLIPSKASGAVRTATQYAKNYVTDTGRLQDDTVYRYCDEREAVKITGGIGAGGFCDTGNCLHFGSRGQTRDRVVFVLRYYPNHRDRPSMYRTFTDAITPQNEVQRLLLA